MDDDSFIHPEFMQCVTAAGRLSSRNLIFKTCHEVQRLQYVRLVVDGGKILEGDYQVGVQGGRISCKDKQVYDDVKKVQCTSYITSIIGVS